ncbi:MAG: hypothetical protein INR71_14135 [Terriglobus roseus]|nr:hypothetical protein [Terriglobus roseus]
MRWGPHLVVTPPPPPLLLLLLPLAALANVEKVVFLAPPPPASSSSSAALPDELARLCLDALAPWPATLSAALPAAFPTDDAPRGIESWFLLDGLVEGRRHEVRLCWAATVRSAPPDTHAAFTDPRVAATH